MGQESTAVGGTAGPDASAVRPYTRLPRLTPGPGSA